ncbi:hypothetical protein D8S78_00675 [Natrialba swarupiae]|nr:hypothetical protein [Natrialba swarupiae]
MLAFSAILPIGYAGQLILAQGAFFGVGAYSFVKLTEAGLPPVVAILVATVFTGVVAYLLGSPPRGRVASTSASSPWRSTSCSSTSSSCSPTSRVVVRDSPRPRCSLGYDRYDPG